MTSLPRVVSLWAKGPSFLDLCLSHPLDSAKGRGWWWWKAWAPTPSANQLHLQLISAKERTFPVQGNGCEPLVAIRHHSGTMGTCLLLGGIRVKQHQFLLQTFWQSCTASPQSLIKNKLSRDTFLFHIWSLFSSSNSELHTLRNWLLNLSYLDAFHYLKYT